MASREHLCVRKDLMFNPQISHTESIYLIQIISSLCFLNTFYILLPIAPENHLNIDILMISLNYGPFCSILQLVGVSFFPTAYL